jgi:tRNA(Arg) A34 adenosine deaminase TadA
MLTATRNEILEALALHADTVIACRVVLESTDRLTLQSELRIEAGSAASHAEWLARNFTVEG